MKWVSSHPYAASAVTAVVVLFLGATYVSQKTALSPGNTGTAWSGTGAVATLPDAPKYIPPTEQNPTNAVPAYKYTSPYGSKNQQASQEIPEEDNSVFDKFSKMVNSKATSSDSSPLDLSSIYTFLPPNMIAAPEMPAEAEESDTQKELRAYGNNIGAIIMSYEQNHPDQAAVLKNHAEDRSNPTKIEALRQLGRDLANVGDLIDQEDPVPDLMKAKHKALADSYREMGQLLAGVADAKGDKAIWDAMVTYNKSAEGFIGAFVPFAQTFSAAGVSFSQSESGSVFMFQQLTGGF